MTLLEAFDALLAETERAFSQQRILARARQLAYGFVTLWGRHTISRALCATRSQFRDWSASYRVFSRSPWEPHDLFQPVFRQCLARSATAGLIPLALDDTTVRKTSKRIPGVSYARDPMSPPFHPNLVMGQRFIQVAAILRPQGLRGPARTIPVRFEPAPPAVKPNKRATEEQWELYRQVQKAQTLSWQAVRLAHDVRRDVDQAGHAGSTLLWVTDGSYCNGTVFRHLPERSELVARARGDMTLFLPPTEAELAGMGRRRKYGAPLPKPDDIRAGDAYPWERAKVFGAGRLHDLRYKVVPQVLWRSGARARSLRLMIIAPLHYRRTGKSRLLYRKPAYLLTSDLTTSAQILIQAYFDRWEIEVNHRDEKSILGVGQAQVWARKAAPRVPQFQVAIYAMLLMASLMAHGPKRTRHYLPLPKWRKREERRPSILDILVLLREELVARAVCPGPYNRRGRAPSRRLAIPLAD